MGNTIVTIDGRAPLILADKLLEQRASQTAAKRAGKSTRTQMVKLTRQHFGLLARDVRERIQIAGVSMRPVRVSYAVDAMPVPLIKFRARQLKRAGVKATIGGRTKTFRGAFRVPRTGKATHRSESSGKEIRGVFRRRTRSRLPIRQLYGPSIADGVEDTFEKSFAVFQEKFPAEFLRALKFGQFRRR